MKIRFLGILMWLLFLSAVLVGDLGLNLTKVQAADIDIVDITSPTTTTTINPALPNGDNNWYKGTVPTVTLIATDVESGIDKTYYKWHATDSYSEYTGVLSAPIGSHTLSYYSTDIVGNSEIVQQTAVFQVDITAPVTKAKGTDTTVTLSAMDAGDMGSGVNKIYYHWDSDTDQEYLSALTLAEGSHILTYYSIDDAGNVEDIQSETFKVETTPPVIPPVVPPVIVVPEVIVTPPPVLEDNSESAEVTVIQPVVEKKISTGISTFVAQTAPEPVITPEVQGESKVIDVPKDTESAPEESRNWNKVLLIISILIIAAGVATGGYYGYEWYMNRKDDGDGSDKSKNKSRW